MLKKGKSHNRDLNVPTVEEEIRKLTLRNENQLQYHTNAAAPQLRNNLDLVQHWKRKSFEQVYLTVNTRAEWSSSSVRSNGHKETTLGVHWMH